MPQPFSEADLKFVVETVADRRSDVDHVVDLVRDKEDFLDQMLDDPRLFDRLADDEDALVAISPYLLFTILLRHVRREIKKEAYLYDYEVGAKKQRVPVFAVPEVSGLLGENEALDYLAGMLASFAATKSIVLTFRDSQGRSLEKRFDDMDIDDMMQLCRQIDPAYRTRYYRRIGDIALFLSGIYPDHAAYYHFLTPRSSRRVSHGRNLHDYEREGQAFYQKAAEQTREPGHGAILSTLAQNFSNARRALNVLSERYLRKNDQRNLFFGSLGST